MYLELDAVFNNDGESLQIDYEFSLEDESVVTPVKVNGSVFNRTGIVNLQADARFDYSTSCAKCNKPLLRHAKVPVHHTLLTHAESEDNDEFIVLDGVRLELDELVSEDIYLALPSRFLCKDDCKGLCAFCGQDLNEGLCSCSAPTDSRWDSLKDLFNE
ncbi:MAG: DUF177 domain-containing protein [Clostridia bacterium]|nr:DUF177 domain-containing protein [Clostridia bacterium]